MLVVKGNCVIGRIKTYNKWIFLNCDYEVGRYYRKLFFNEFLIKLQAPSNGSHITVISEYDDVIINNYKYIDDMVCSFEILPELYTNLNAIWLNVVSQDLNDIRALIGLGKPDYPLHFCIGYLHQNERKYN
jgi:hypothetical protein